MPGGIVQQVSDDEMIVRVKLPDLEKFASVDERDAATAMRDIASNFQKININADINLVTDTVTNGIDTEEINVIEIGASSKLIPLEFMKIFDGFEGVYMISVVWNSNKKLWDYEVIVYTK